MADVTIETNSDPIDPNFVGVYMQGVQYGIQFVILYLQSLLESDMLTTDQISMVEDLVRNISGATIELVDKE